MAKKGIFRRIINVVIALIVVVVLVAGGYVAYVSASYYRIGDADLTIDNNAALAVGATNEFSAVTYNIGFGAYSPEFDFFMDGGKGSTAKNKDEVLKNTNGAADAINALNADFMFMQEVDVKSTRSKKVNQYQTILDSLVDFGGVYSENFHSPFLAYPIFNPHGKVKSGIAFYSKYTLDNNAKRKELPVTTKWPAKIFDLDRCYQISRISLQNGKELVLVNIHLTAYDKGGVIRAAQLESLISLFTAEKESGNYVVMGGDFNHDLISTFGENPEDYFTYTKPNEEWVQVFPDSFINAMIENGYSFAFPVNEPTCRSSAYPYVENESRVWTIDGFIVSDNIEVLSIATANPSSVAGYTNFIYSDHNPVKLDFKLI